MITSYYSDIRTLERESMMILIQLQPYSMKLTLIIKIILISMGSTLVQIFSYQILIIMIKRSWYVLRDSSILCIIEHVKMVLLTLNLNQSLDSAIIKISIWYL